MELYPDKIDGTLHIMRYAHGAVYRPFFFFGDGVYIHPPNNYYSFSLRRQKEEHDYFRCLRKRWMSLRSSEF